MTEVEAANIALAIIGQYRITSLNDNTVNASLCSLYLPVAKNDVLTYADWPRARKRAVIPELSEEPAFGDESAFGLPADCLKVVEVDNIDPPYRIERVGTGPALIAGATGSLNIIYTADLNVSEMPNEMAVAVAHRLAYYIVGPAAGKENQRGMLLQLYLESLKNAYAAELGEQAGMRRPTLRFGPSRGSENN